MSRYGLAIADMLDNVVVGPSPSDMSNDQQADIASERLQRAHDAAYNLATTRERARIRSHLVRQLVAAQWAMALYACCDAPHPALAWDVFKPVPLAVVVAMSSSAYRRAPVDIVDEMLGGAE